MAEILTYDQWMDALQERASKIPRIQAVISNFEVLPRLGKLLSVKAQECPECSIYWKKLQEATKHLDQFFEDGNRYSIDFDNLVSEILKHLKGQHSIKPKGLTLALYCVIGMVGGVFLGVIIGFAAIPESIKGSVVLGWLLGVMIGWFSGKLKEEKMRKANQIF